MKSRQQKTKDLKILKGKMGKSRFAVFTSFAGVQGDGRGLNVQEMAEMKSSLRKVESEYLVAKKRLINIVSEPKGVDASGFQGSLGIVFGFGDEAASAKTAYDFSKRFPALKIFGALFGSRFIGQEQVIELAKLPNREVMLGRAIGMISYPLTGLVNALQANIRNLLLVLSNIKK